MSYIVLDESVGLQLKTSRNLIHQLIVNSVAPSARVMVSTMYSIVTPPRASGDFGLSVPKNLNSSQQRPKDKKIRSTSKLRVSSNFWSFVQKCEWAVKQM